MQYPLTLPKNVGKEIVDTRRKGARIKYSEPMYPTVEAFAKRCDEYFKKCLEAEEHPTKTGLCLALGFSDRRQLLGYRERPEFRYVAERASLMVEHGYEQALMSRHSAGAKFALRQMGWVDEGDGTGKPLNVQFNVVFTNAESGSQVVE